MSVESVSVIDEGLRHLLRCAEQNLVEDLELKPCPIPEDLASIAGSIEGEPLVMRTRRYRGTRLSALTLATLETRARLVSLTVIGLPRPNEPLPVLGIDLIGLRGALSLVAIDLAPTDMDFWSLHCARLLSDVHAGTKDAVVYRKHPEFIADVFSPLALIAGVQRGREAPIFAATEQLMRAVKVLITQPLVHGCSPMAEARRARWLSAEKQNRKEHNALARMFGAAVARRYLDDFLFASEERAVAS